MSNRNYNCNDCVPKGSGVRIIAGNPPTTIDCDTCFGTGKKVLAPIDVAKIFDVTPATVYEWLNSEKLPAERGKRRAWLIQPDDVRELAERKYGART